MPRNRKGYLKADALISGYTDQWAQVIGAKRHEITLLHDKSQGGFVAQHVIIDVESTLREVHVWQTGTNVYLARQFFEEAIKKAESRGA